MTWQLINHKGYLAITLGYSVDQNEPTETMPVWYNPKEKWDEHYYSQYTQIRLVENNNFSCFSSKSYSYKWLCTDGWTYENVTRPIPKPGRGGKDWSWAWSSWSHRWIKQYV